MHKHGVLAYPDAAERENSCRNIVNNMFLGVRLTLRSGILTLATIAAEYKGSVDAAVCF